MPGTHAPPFPAGKGAWPQEPHAVPSARFTQPTNHTAIGKDPAVRIEQETKAGAQSRCTRASLLPGTWMVGCIMQNPWRSSRGYSSAHARVCLHVCVRQPSLQTCDTRLDLVLTLVEKGKPSWAPCLLVGNPKQQRKEGVVVAVAVAEHLRTLGDPAAPALRAPELQSATSWHMDPRLNFQPTLSSPSCYSNSKPNQNFSGDLHHG